VDDTVQLHDIVTVLTLLTLNMLCVIEGFVRSIDRAALLDDSSFAHHRPIEQQSTHNVH